VIHIPQVTYTQIYDTLSAIHRKHYPAKLDGDYFADASTDLIQAIAELNHHPFASALALEIYHELERTAKRE